MMKWIQWLWIKLFGKLKPMEKIEKVIAWINWLNSLTPGQKWVAVQGYNMMPVAEMTQVGLKFNQNRGFVVKVFQNTSTGEIRSFSYTYFE